MSGKNHAELVAGIKASGSTVHLTVRQLGVGLGKSAASASTSSASSASTSSASASAPAAFSEGVLLTIAKGAAGFGFNLATNKEEEHIFRVVDASGPAQAVRCCVMAVVHCAQRGYMLCVVGRRAHMPTTSCWP